MTKPVVVMFIGCLKVILRITYIWNHNSQNCLILNDENRKYMNFSLHSYHK